MVHSLSGAEAPSFNLKRPVRTVALEPNFAKSGSRSVISGGMAGNLILHEKGWLGYKETTLHSGEGPVWQVRWRNNLIAWANDIVGSGLVLVIPLVTVCSTASELVGSEDIRHPVSD